MQVSMLLKKRMSKAASEIKTFYEPEEVISITLQFQEMGPGGEVFLHGAEEEVYGADPVEKLECVGCAGES